MFDELQLNRGLRLGLENLALDTPTEVQKQVVPAALAGKDLQVCAETGSGKTLAYLIPSVETILQSVAQNSSTSAEGTLLLVLVPTRELARQVVKHCRALVSKTPLSVQGITGGADFKYQKSLLRKDPEVVIATPGRLLEHCQKRSAHLAALQTLVLDEADRMLDMGFRDDVIAIKEYCSPSAQVMMLSATAGHGGVQTIAKQLLKKPQQIDINPGREPHSSIEHQLILADSQAHKDKLLSALLSESQFERALVFGNKRTTAVRLGDLLRGQRLRCAALHGEMSTENRRSVMDQFHDGKVNVLCASDVAARGLDIRGVDLVINYDMPFSGDDYLHRSGRTGRAGASGIAVSFVTASEWNLMVSIERYLGLDFARRSLEGLKARYNGPKKVKSNGKAAGPKKKKTTRSKSGSVNKRKTNAASKGGKRKPSGQTSAVSNDGFAPLRKKSPKR